MSVYGIRTRCIVVYPCVLYDGKRYIDLQIHDLRTIYFSPYTVSCVKHSFSNCQT